MLTAIVIALFLFVALSPIIAIVGGIVSGLRARRRIDAISRRLSKALAESERR